MIVIQSNSCSVLKVLTSTHQYCSHSLHTVFKWLQLLYLKVPSHHHITLPPCKTVCTRVHCCQYYYIHFLLLIVPSSSPQSFNTSALSSTSVHLSWLPPPAADINGIIQYYNLSFIEINTGSLTWNTVTTTSSIVNNLHPFYTYEFSVTAVTVGEGPSTIFILQMPESGINKAILICSICCYSSPPNSSFIRSL